MPKFRTSFNVGDTVYFMWWNEIQSSEIISIKISEDADRSSCRYIVAPIKSAKEGITLDESKVYGTAREVFEMIASQYSRDHLHDIPITIVLKEGNA